jgi:hypothetical protein
MLDVIKTFFTGSVGEDDSILMDAEKIRKKYCVDSLSLIYLAASHWISFSTW